MNRALGGRDAGHLGTVTPVTEGSGSACHCACDDAGSLQAGGLPAAKRTMGCRVMTGIKQNRAILGDRLFNYLTAAMAVLALWAAIGA